MAVEQTDFTVVTHPYHAVFVLNPGERVTGGETRGRCVSDDVGPGDARGAADAESKPHAGVRCCPEGIDVYHRLAVGRGEPAETPAIPPRQRAPSRKPQIAFRVFANLVDHVVRQSVAGRI